MQHTFCNILHSGIHLEFEKNVSQEETKDTLDTTLPFSFSELVRLGLF